MSRFTISPMRVVYTNLHLPLRLETFYKDRKLRRLLVFTSFLHQRFYPTSLGPKSQD